MKFIIYFCFFLAACFFHPLIAAEKITKCSIYFDAVNTCNYKHISALLIVKKISDDEIQLEQIQLNNQQKKSVLNITNNTYMIEGDRGYISFSDINFDGVADISITTSFGLANLYLDYWVYDPHKQEYLYVGNFTKFNFMHKNKTLSNRIKLNASEYQTIHYFWQGYNLLKQAGSK